MNCALLAAALCGASRPALAQSHRVIGVYAVWFDGHGDSNRVEMDRFFDCLINGSNLNSYWQGEAGLEFRGSWALPAPKHTLGPEDVAGWLTPHVAAGALAVGAKAAGETPLYVVMGGLPQVAVGGCGLVVDTHVNSQRSGVALVRNSIQCWKTGDILRSETQIAMHEIVETADSLLGYAPCAADGACEGASKCEDRCGTFVGLTCPGAPKASWTGCDGGKVDGWVVQKLGYEGRVPASCNACFTCGFVPKACDGSDPNCAAVPQKQVAEKPPTAADTGACSIARGARTSSSHLWWLLAIAAAVLRWSRSARSRRPRRKTL